MGVSVGNIIASATEVAFDPFEAAGKYGRLGGQFLGEEVYYKTHGVSETLENVLESSKAYYAGARIGYDDPTLLKRAFASTSVNAEKLDKTDLALRAVGATLSAKGGDDGQAFKELAVDYAKQELEGAALNGIAAATGSAVIAYGAVEGTKAGVLEYADIGARHEATLLSICGEARTFDTMIDENTVRAGGLMDFNAQGTPIPGFTAGVVQIGDEHFTIITDATPFAEGKDYYHTYILDDKAQFINPEKFNERLVELQNSEDPVIAAQAGTAVLAQQSLALGALDELNAFATETRVDELGNTYPTKIDQDKYQEAVNAELAKNSQNIGQVAARISNEIEAYRPEPETPAPAEPAASEAAPKTPVVETPQTTTAPPPSGPMV